MFRAGFLAVGFAAVSAFGGAPEAPSLLPAVATAPVEVGEEIADFYRSRGFRPLWGRGRALRPEATELLRSLPPDPELSAAVAAAGTGDPDLLSRAELLLSSALVEQVRELRRPPLVESMRYADPALAPATSSAAQVLQQAAAAPAEAGAALRVNPAFDGLRIGLERYRARWSRLPQTPLPSRPDPAQLRQRLGFQPAAPEAMVAARLREFQAVHGMPPSGRADAATLAALNRGAVHYERLILANLERARAIPARRGRYILVDTASARLWMVEDGRLAGSMRVVVGKAEMPTPQLAGTISHAVLNPYWNLPPDLIRERARKVLRRGSQVIAAERLQVLSDWTPRARILSARRVDWRSVAAGRHYVNLRQRPGPGNMMGRVKFMVANPLGIYLHDTPLTEHFEHSDRRLSSGCVRVEDAQRLAAWLFRGSPPAPSGRPEQRVDLPEPVPVYIAYFTALPTSGGVVFQADRYGRDRAWLERLDRARRTG